MRIAVTSVTSVTNHKNMENPTKTHTNAQGDNDRVLLQKIKDLLTNKESKRKGNHLRPTLEDIKQLALIRFGSYQNIGSHIGGYSKVYAFRILNGDKKIVKDITLQKIADGLGIPVGTLRNALNDHFGEQKA